MSPVVIGHTTTPSIASTAPIGPSQSLHILSTSIDGVAPASAAALSPYDNDEINTIEDNKYFRVEIFYSEQKLTFNVFKNNLDNYEYKDHILGKIELWRANQIFKMNDSKEEKTKMVVMNVKYHDNANNKNVEGIYDLNNDKIVFDVSDNKKEIYYCYYY